MDAHLNAKLLFQKWIHINFGFAVRASQRNKNNNWKSFYFSFLCISHGRTSTTVGLGRAKKTNKWCNIWRFVEPNKRKRKYTEIFRDRPYNTSQWRNTTVPNPNSKRRKWTHKKDARKSFGLLPSRARISSSFSSMNSLQIYYGSTYGVLCCIHCRNVCMRYKIAIEPNGCQSTAADIINLSTVLRSWILYK